VIINTFLFCGRRSASSLLLLLLLLLLFLLPVDVIIVVIVVAVAAAAYPCRLICSRVVPLDWMMPKPLPTLTT
jgi:hypothetical protein